MTVELTGDVTAARACPVWSPACSLDDFVAALCSGAPGAGRVLVALDWSEAASALTFSSQTADWCARKRLVLCPDGPEVAFDLYQLANHHQNTGLAKRMLRNLTLVYEMIGVEAVAAYANFEVGGYAWAKVAARPLDDQREPLLKRLPEVADLYGFAQEDAAALGKLIEQAPTESLMRDVACAVGGEDYPVGKYLLLGHKWEAYWDLTDDAQRVAIIEALS